MIMKVFSIIPCLTLLSQVSLGFPSLDPDHSLSRQYVRRAIAPELDLISAATRLQRRGTDGQGTSKQENQSPRKEPFSTGRPMEAPEDRVDSLGNQKAHRTSSGTMALPLPADTEHGQHAIHYDQQGGQLGKKHDIYPQGQGGRQEAFQTDSGKDAKRLKKAEEQAMGTPLDKDEKLNNKMVKKPDEPQQDVKNLLKDESRKGDHRLLHSFHPTKLMILLQRRECPRLR